MTSTVLRRLFFLVINFALINTISAQSNVKIDTGSSVYKAELLFNAKIRQQSLLFNGPAFQPYPFNLKNSPNFQELNKFSIGTVVYQGFRFENIPLMYNLHQDKVVSLLEGVSKYTLLSDRVAEFYLNNHHFKYINVIDTTKSIIKTGFYDLIYNGKHNILSKRAKSLQFSTDDKEIWYYFVPRTQYYIEKDNKYTIISGQKSFLSYFKDKKTELKKQLRQNKLKFRKNPEESMILLAKYYESLSN